MTVFEAAQAGRGNSNDHVRRHNLAVILELVHRNRALSRAQLTRLTGLNRSTVSALVAELVERDLAVETDPDPSNQVGRPSPIVQPGPHVVGIAVNPEIDAVTVGAVGFGGRVLGRVRRPTAGPPTAREAVAISAGAIEELRGRLGDGYRVTGVGIAMPGLVRASDGLVRLAPHLGWLDEPFAELLGRATDYPVVAANDARLGAVAESIFGAGRGITDLIYLNGGASGIGGGIIAGGTPLGGVAGYAGEFGHTMVNPQGVECHCGAIGCLETELRRERLLALVGLTNADADELEAALMASPSPEVLAEVHRQLDYLAVALRNAINILNPQLIVLGGFLGSLYAVAPVWLDEAVARQPLKAARESVRITRAQLGSDLLMIGAGELAFERLLADPAAF